MQRRGAPEQVEADPAGVEPELVIVGPVQDHQPVREVRDEQADDARAHQVERRPALSAVQREPDRNRQQQHVRERVRNRDEARGRRQRVVVEVGNHEPDPRREREAHGHDRRVDGAAAIAAAAAAALEDQQARDERRVDEQVSRVAERREGDLAVEQQRVAVRVEVTEPEEREADGEAAPGGPGARLVEPHAGEDRQHRREAQHVHERAAALERRARAGTGRGAHPLPRGRRSRPGGRASGGVLQRLARAQLARGGQPLERRDQ